MADRKSIDVFRRFCEIRYWEEENRGLFSRDCALEFPYAPPGMPEYFPAGERHLHFNWLCRSTRDWIFEDEHRYLPRPDGDVFWLRRTCSCTANWGGLKDRSFKSHFILKLTIRNGEITGFREYSNPLAYLETAGRELPHFPFLLDPAAVEAERPMVEKKRNGETFVCDDPPEVCEARKQRTLETLRYFRNDPERFMAMEEAPNIDGLTLFAPPDMTEDASPHRCPGILDWLMKSEYSARFTLDTFPLYETEDPDVYFDECCYDGDVEWVGAPKGHYRNRYVMWYVFDHGYMKECSEALNPINKFNSINVSIPTFPYYFD